MFTLFSFLHFFLPPLYFFTSSSPLLHLPLPKVRCLTVVLSKLVYSEVSKTAQRVYREDLGEIHLVRRDRQKGETRKKNRALHWSVEWKTGPQVGQSTAVTIPPSTFSGSLLALVSFCLLYKHFYLCFGNTFSAIILPLNSSNCSQAMSEMWLCWSKAVYL